jgi:hypothetical protein
MPTTEKKYIATKHLTNSSGIGIYDIDDTEEIVHFSYCFEGNHGRVLTANLQHDVQGRLYFSSRDYKHYIEDFIRTNYGGV